MHAIRKKYAYNHVHNATSLQTVLTELAGADGVRALQDALAPKAGTAHSVANSVSFLNSMMLNSDTDSEYTEDQLMVLAPTAALPRSSASLANASTRNPRRPMRARKRKKRRPRTMSQRRTRASIASNTTARSHIVSNWTNACETKNIRDTASSRSAMSLRLISSHTSNFGGLGRVCGEGRFGQRMTVRGDARGRRERG